MSDAGRAFRAIPDEREWFWIRLSASGLRDWYAVCGDGIGVFGEPGAGGFSGRTRERALLKALRFLSRQQVEYLRTYGVWKPILLEE